jgi:t-SNARE complex subunit (syntaxin)
MDGIELVQAQVDETSNLMQKNIRVVSERGEKLERIDSNAKLLEQNASIFKSTTKKLKCSLIRKNIKLSIIIIVLGILLIVALGISIPISVEGYQAPKNTTSW